MGLWLPGLTATLIRDFFYCSIRLGCYPFVRDFMFGQKSVGGTNEDAGFLYKSISALTTGAIASIVSNPTDVVKIRLMANPNRYKNTFSAYYHVGRDEGSSGLMRGVVPSTFRGAAICAGEIATYDHTKHLLKKKGFEEGYTLHFFASFITGLVATTVAAPFDVLRARIMNDSGHEYKSTLDCLTKLIKNDGPFALFRGWLPAYYRLGTWAFIFFPIYEQMRILFNLGYF